MKTVSAIDKKIVSREELQRMVSRWRILGNKIIFTNGCFDILHEGHLEVLGKAAVLGNILIVGVNSDRSVEQLKGPHRPINNETSRMRILASLLITDAVTLFDEETPLELIQAIMPDVVVKGGDYKHETVVGADIVVKNGGEVVIVPLLQGYSTTGLIQKIQAL